MTFSCLHLSNTANICSVYDGKSIRRRENHLTYTYLLGVIPIPVEIDVDDQYILRICDCISRIRPRFNSYTTIICHEYDENILRILAFFGIYLKKHYVDVSNSSRIRQIKSRILLLWGFLRRSTLRSCSLRRCSLRRNYVERNYVERNYVGCNYVGALYVVAAYVVSLYVVLLYVVST